MITPPGGCMAESLSFCFYFQGFQLQETQCHDEPAKESRSQTRADRGTKAGDQRGIRSVRHRRVWNDRCEGTEGRKGLRTVSLMLASKDHGTASEIKKRVNLGMT